MIAIVHGYVIGIYFAIYGLNVTMQDISDEVLPSGSKEGRIGRTAGKGFYDYN